MTRSGQKKRFVTIMPNLHDVHLNKDPGQMSYYFVRLFGFRSTVVCYDNGPYPSLRKTVSGVDMEHLNQRWKSRFFDPNVIEYVLRNARSIDVLTMNHFNFHSLLNAFLYKLVNPKGFFILRLDFHQSCPGSDGKWFKRDRRLRTLVKNFLQMRFVKKIDLWRIHNQEAMRYLKKRYPFMADDLILSFNGLDLDLISKLQITPLEYDQKKNIILQVGRIGSHEKGVDLLLEAFAGIAPEVTWDLHLAGPVSESFQPFIQSFLEHHPSLKERIVFHGDITDRAKLFDIYNQAKILCIPSRMEGFPQVAPEAMYFCNTVITTEVGGAEMVTGGGKRGRIVPIEDVAGLANALRESIGNEKWLRKSGLENRDIVKSTLNWETIANKLYSEMLKRGHR